MKKLTAEEIEEIITYEVVVDCYSDDEVNMGWAIFLGDGLNCPFTAEYEVKKKDGTSEWKEVVVVGTETDDSNYEGGPFYVEIELGEHIIPVRLLELRNFEADTETLRTIQVWEYQNQN